MCGVFGFIGAYQTQERDLAAGLMVKLALAHQERGDDASGYAALTAGGEMVWDKQPMPARRFFTAQTFAPIFRKRLVAVIGHTRHATLGAPAVNANNHPHLAGDWAVVHNGHLHGHRIIALSHGLRLTSECDSELLARALAHYGEVDGPVVCLGMGGSQSVLAINRRSRHLLAWTNGEQPLVAFRVDGLPGLWWASTQAIATHALDAVNLTARFAAARPEVVYRLELRQGEVAVHTDRPEGPADDEEGA
jgi:glucosamine 6-phosphate synthetase-like amidotransferase/phosphosugar isomerase protein